MNKNLPINQNLWKKQETFMETIKEEKSGKQHTVIWKCRNVDRILEIEQPEKQLEHINGRLQEHEWKSEDILEICSVEK